MGYSGNMYAQATEVITSQGDLRRGDSSGNPERLAIGSSGKFLKSNGTTESWETITTADSTLTTQGDILYEGASGLARLGQSTSNYTLATKGASANPAWQASPTSILSGAQDILYSSAANTLARLGAGTDGDLLTTHGTGSAPTWETPSGGGAWSFVESFTLSSNASSWTITPSTAMDLEAYQEFMLKIMLAPIAPEGDLSVQINGDTSAAYMVEAFDVDETTVSGISADGQTSSSIITNCTPARPVRLEISWIYSPAAGDTAQMGRFYCSAGDQRMTQGYFALSDVLTEISELKITMSAGTITATGATAKLYRLSLS